MNFFIACIYFALLSTNFIYSALTVHTSHPNEQTIEIVADFMFENNDFLYKDYLDFSVDNPTVTLSEWKSSREPVNHYDTKFKNTKKIFSKPVTFTLTAHRPLHIPDTPAHLHINYYIHSKKRMLEKTVPLYFRPVASVDNPLVSEEPPFISPLQTNVPIDTSPARHAPTSSFTKHVNLLAHLTATILNWPHLFWTVLLFMVVVGAFLLAMELNLWSLKRIKSQIWTYELTKLYQGLILGFCFYYARKYISPYLLLTAIALCTATIGVFYIHQSEKTPYSRWRTMRTVIGITLLAGSFIIGFYAYKTASLALK